MSKLVFENLNLSFFEDLLQLFSLPYSLYVQTILPFLIEWLTFNLKNIKVFIVHVHFWVKLYLFVGNSTTAMILLWKKCIYILFSGTEAFHKFLNLISSCDSLLYSDYFYSFLTSEEHNEAVSHIKLGRYGEAVNLLETIFHIREKLLTATNIMVREPTYLSVPKIFTQYVIFLGTHVSLWARCLSLGCRQNWGSICLFSGNFKNIYIRM